MGNDDADILRLLAVEADREDVGLIVVILQRLLDTKARRGLYAFRIVEIFRDRGTGQSACGGELFHRPDLLFGHALVFPRVHSDFTALFTFLSMRKFFSALTQQISAGCRWTIHAFLLPRQLIWSHHAQI